MFNEKKEEYSTKQGCNIPVWQSAKYIEAKSKALELIKSGKYDLSEGDFWILMNETKTGKMQYSGLIISHNGCLKINDKLENKFKTNCITLDKEGYNNSLVYTYVDDEVYEIGEVSKTNCKNEYPYAMAFKRCFDRVVLKKSKLAYAGVYSDSEADEFNGKDIEQDIDETINKTKQEALKTAIKNNMLDVSGTDKDILKKYGYNDISEIKLKDYMKIVEEFRLIAGVTK